MSKPCKNCGRTERNKYGQCVLCKREGIKKWKQNNPEKVREQGRRKYWRDPEKQNARASEWRKENPEKDRSYTHTRRALKKQGGGSFTASEWKALCEQYDNKCCYPGCDRTDLHMDHVIPLSKGGSSDISNIQPLCGYHNMSKGTKKTDYRTKPGLKRWIQKTIFGF